jgi:hypothetical protein
MDDTEKRQSAHSLYKLLVCWTKDWIWMVARFSRGVYSMKSKKHPGKYRTTFIVAWNDPTRTTDKFIDLDFVCKWSHTRGSNILTRPSKNSFSYFGGTLVIARCECTIASYGQGDGTSSWEWVCALVVGTWNMYFGYYRWGKADRGVLDFDE